MNFLTDDQTIDAVRGLLQEASPCCAVAFWGRGADQLFGDGLRPDAKIICNLSMGGTNPNVIRALQERGVAVRHHDHLHAKVYIGATRAVVTSANASSNGLGFEGAEATGWKEAGILSDDPIRHGEIRSWFDALWAESALVIPQVLEAALAEWLRHQRNRPQSVSFKDYEIHEHVFPLINWLGNEDLHANETLLQGLEDTSRVLMEEILDDSIPIEGKDEIKYLSPGRWMFCYSMTSRGNPNQRNYPVWHQVGRVIENAMKDNENKLYDVVTNAASGDKVPFSIDRKFYAKFLGLLIKDEFARLRDMQYLESENGLWFTQERINLMRHFWEQLKAN